MEVRWGGVWHVIHIHPTQTSGQTGVWPACLASGHLASQSRWVILTQWWDDGTTTDIYSNNENNQWDHQPDSYGSSGQGTLLTPQVIYHFHCQPATVNTSDKMQLLCLLSTRSTNDFNGRVSRELWSSDSVTWYLDVIKMGRSTKTGRESIG